jgi:modulator of FtsH protease
MQNIKRIGFGDVAVEKSKVLTDTMRLLSYTLVFGGLASWFSVWSGAGGTGAIVASVLAIIVIWFVLPKTQNSIAGIPTAFAIAGLLGYSIGPLLGHYLSMANGTELVMQALMGTGVSFFGISYYAQTTKKDFSFMNGMIFFAMIAVIVLSVVNMFFIQSGIVSLGISFAVVMLMGAYLLSQMSSIVNGGETNYISATVGLYIGLHNMFAALLHILGAMSDD